MTFAHGPKLPKPLISETFSPISHRSTDQMCTLPRLCFRCTIKRHSWKKKKKTYSDRNSEMYYVKSERRYPKMNAPYPDVRWGKIEVGNESKTFHFKIWSRWKDLTAFTEARPMFLGCQRTVSQPLTEDQKLLGVQVLQKPSRYKIWQINREG